MPRLIFHLLCGIPASGKSTYSQYLGQFPNTEILSTDLIRLELTGDINNQSKNSKIFCEIVPIRIKEICRRNHNLVFDATSYCRRARYGIIQYAKSSGYYVKAHVFRVPLDECIKRNRARDKTVPDDVIIRMHKNWEDPELEEGIGEIYEVPLNWREKSLTNGNNYPKIDS